MLTSYLDANRIVLTMSGWLSAVIGRKRYFLICILMFTVCSFLGGIAGSIARSIVFRVLKGFFGGGLQPGQESIILDMGMIAVFFFFLFGKKGGGGAAH